MTYPEYPEPQPSYPQPQYPQPQGPYQSPAPNRGPQIIAVIAAIVAVAAVVAVVLLFVNSVGDDDVAAPESSGTVVTEYVQAPPSPGSDTDTQIKQPPAPSTTPSTPQQSNPQLPVPPIMGANAHGFIDQPMCDDDADPLVFIGYTQRSNVIICQVGRQTGRYYYKGMADGNLSHVDFPTRSGNTFTATNGNTSYIVSPQSLVITENGRVLTTEPMREAWVN